MMDIDRDRDREQRAYERDTKRYKQERIKEGEWPQYSSMYHQP